MSLSDNHIVAGLPAWATEEEAKEAASALGSETSDQDVSNTTLMLMARREEWKQIRAAAIVGRSQAINAGAFELSRQLEGIISDAERYIDPMIAAVFELQIPAVPEKGENRLFDALREMGKVVSSDRIKEAHAVIRARTQPKRTNERSIKTKVSTSENRVAVQEYVREKSPVREDVVREWATEQGFSDKIVRAMIRDKELVLTRKGVLLVG